MGNKVDQPVKQEENLQEKQDPKKEEVQENAPEKNPESAQEKPADEEYVLNAIKKEKIMSPEAFKKATYVRAAKRGEFLTQIDEALEGYYKFAEKHGEQEEDQDQVGFAQNQLTALKKLAKLETACKNWLDRHMDTKYTSSVFKRRGAVAALKASAGFEVVKLTESIQKMRPEKTGSVLKADFLPAFNGGGLPPYDEFVRKIDAISILGLVDLSDDMKERRMDGEDRYLTQLLKKYRDFQRTADRDNKLNQAVDKNTYKKVTSVKYTSLLDLEKACNDWMTAHASKSGMLYKVKTLTATPATVRRNIIGALLEKGGPIEKEKEMLKASFQVMSDVAAKEKGSKTDVESLDFEKQTGKRLKDIYSLKTFKNLTDAGTFSTRGDNLKKIDGLIQQYHAAKEGKDPKKTAEFLKQLYTACTFWMKLHEGDSTGSVQHRFPVIQDVAETAKRLLGKDKVPAEEIEKLDSAKSFDAVVSYRGVTVGRGSLPTLEEFKKMTYVSKTSRRGKELNLVDSLLLQYHETVEKGDAGKALEVLWKLYIAARTWIKTFEKDTGEDVRYRLPVVKNLSEQAENMVKEQKKVSADAGDKKGEEKKDSKDSGEKAEGGALEVGGLLPTLEQFQKMTYAGKTSTRGSYLQNIDKTILQYDRFRVKREIDENEQENAMKALGGIHRACLVWQQRHDGEGGGSVGLRKLYIEKMTGEEGLVAREANYLIQEKILTKEVNVSQSIISDDSLPGQDSVFNKIGSEFTNKIGNEKSHFKIGGYISVSCPYVPGTNARVNIAYIHDGEKNGVLDDYDKGASEDNIRSKILSEHKIELGITGKVLFIASANANVRFGMYTQARAHTAEDCAKLMKFCTYGNIRSSRLMPKWVTNKLYGGAFGQEGYKKAEQSQSEAVGVLSQDGKNYIEEGKSIGGEVSAGVKVLGSASAGSTTRGFRKVINREVIREALASLQKENPDMKGIEPAEIPYEQLSKKYLEMSGIRDDKVEEQNSADIHRRIHGKRQGKESASYQRTVTTRIKRAKLIRDFKSGVLRKVRIEDSFDADQFIDGANAVKCTAGLLRMLEDCYSDDKDNHFEMMDLDLDSFKKAVSSGVASYPPLIQMRKISTIKKLIAGKSIGLTLELDTKRKLLKLYISRIKLDSMIAGAPAMLANYSTIKSGVDKAGDIVGMLKGAAETASDAATAGSGIPKVDGGLDLEFNSSAEDMLGYWKLPSSSFKASTSKKPQEQEKPDTPKGPEKPPEKDKPDPWALVLAELKQKLAERESKKKVSS